MYKDYDYDYKAYDKNGKEQLIKLDFMNQKLYGWQSARVHLAEGAGGSATFAEVLKQDSWWYNWIKEVFGNEVLTAILQKIKTALKEEE